MEKKDISRFIQKQYSIWRILSLCFFILMAGRLAESVYHHTWTLSADPGQLIPPVIVFLLAIVGTLFSLFLIFYPEYVTILGYFSLIYSCSILVDSPFHPFGAFGYLFSAYLLMPRSFSTKKAYWKAAAIAGLFVAVSCSGIRFGVVPFIRNVGITLGQVITVVGILSIHDAQRIEAITSPALFQKTIILTKQYSFLTDRDIEWILKIVNGEKYLSIAVASGYSEGYVRNYMSELYKRMELDGGRNELIRLFSENNIVVTEDDEGCDIASSYPQ